MILGTPRGWWIAAGLFFVVGLVLVAGGVDSPVGAAAGVLLIIAAMLVFAMAPMRYGRGRSAPPSERATSTDPLVPPADDPPRPRVQIEGRDPSDV
jgi:drug/metabolite transporter (DMT)-like permease